MFFFRDHQTPQTAAPFNICINNGSEQYSLDRRLRPLGQAPWFLNNNGINTRQSSPRIR